MKLYTFRAENKDRIGSIIRGHLVDLIASYEVMTGVRGRKPDALPVLPPTIRGLLRLGEKGLDAAVETLAFMSKRPAVPVGSRLTYALDEVELLPPLNPGKILAMGQDRSFFQKVPSAIIADHARIMIPNSEPNVVSQGCVAAIIGKPTRAISESDVPAHIAGYTILNDLSAPTLLNQPTLGKNFDTFCPIGPCLATPDELTQATEAQYRLFRNGQIVRRGSIRDCLDMVAGAIVTLANGMTLEPGDVVAVPLCDGDFALVNRGDTLALEIDGIGRLENSAGPD